MMKIAFNNNPYFLTKITGEDLNEIQEYCTRNNLKIVETFKDIRKGFVVQAQKPNQRMRVLRKRVENIEGWKLIDDTPTKKMHWLIYEKDQQSSK